MRRHLDLGDPLASPADAPAGWGDTDETDAQVAHRYRSQVPPHHGST